MTRKTLTFELFALIAITAHAQHFDWAKGYGSSQEGCLIKGTVTDGDGNLYILGQFTKDATWDGQRILPIAPYGSGQNSINTLIAKISPSGEMLWKKVIHSNNNQNTLSYDIKPIGDTSFACLVNVNLPTSGNYCYFLDTLLPTWSEYPVPLTAETTTSACFTTYLVFDFSGNVLEQHFIQVSYIDTTGNDYVFHYSQPNVPDKLFSYPLTNPSFDVDANGNIYICRQSADHFDNMISVEEGSAIGLKFWVDKQCVGTVYVNDGDHPRWVPQMLKFSPHMTTLTNSRYIFQSNNGTIYSGDNPYIKLDGEEQLFLIGNLSMSGMNYDTLMIDSAQNVSLSHSDINTNWGYLICYNDDLLPQYCVSLKDSIVGSIPPTTSRTFFHDIDFDSDSNMLFVSGFAQKNNNATSMYAYTNTLLSIERNDAFVLSIDKTAGSYQSCSVIPSLASSNLGTLESRGNLTAKNNRILIQNQYYAGIQFPNQIVHAQDNNPGLCLTMFDYSGHLIAGIDYNSFHPRNRPGSISMADSVLYLSNLLRADATFGDISVSEQGYFSCVARYVDTAFMTPYVHTEEPGEVSITLVEGGNAFVAYPNPFRQSVRIKVQGGQLKKHNGTVTAILTDLSGRREQVRLTAEGAGRYSLDLTSRPQATYLLTLTTADGKQHTVRLLKQSDIFSR